MANRPPDYCPYCGTELVAVDPPTAFRCGDCEELVFHNPIPCVRLAVVDGDRILLVEVPGDHDPGLWTTPGGCIEAGEHPPATGARELREETTLIVDPEALAFFDARTYTKWDEVHKTSLLYAVDAADVQGEPTGADEHSAARYWEPAAFADADVRMVEFHDEPDRYRDPAWWLAEARAAIGADE